MSVAKVIEISAESSKSFEDAMHQGIKKAGETIQNMRGAWINEQMLIIKDQKVVGYRVNMKVTFVVD
jgi:flavin-binding protein dodecin